MKKPTAKHKRNKTLTHELEKTRRRDERRHGPWSNIQCAPDRMVMTRLLNRLRSFWALLCDSNKQISVMEEEYKLLEYSLQFFVALFAFIRSIPENIAMLIKQFTVLRMLICFSCTQCLSVSLKVINSTTKWGHFGCKMKWRREDVVTYLKVHTSRYYYDVRQEGLRKTYKIVLSWFFSPGGYFRDINFQIRYIWLRCPMKNMWS